MQEKIGDAPDHKASADEKLKVIVQKRNQDVREYFDKRYVFETIATDIRQLIDLRGKNIDEVLSDMSDIESSLEVVSELFTELGFMTEHGGEFDIDYYRCMRLERRIANRNITELEEIPEEFRDSLGYMLDSDDDEYPRNTASIHDDLRDEYEELGYRLKSYHDFSDYMPEGRKKETQKLKTEREQLNTLLDEFKRAAKSVAYHF
ncbi:hypothetical protein [Noviherbaspirillum suwonense]|uniref:Uncharacterized protein n=1 Tax=Noviherbaspirillum suwonense TaxID=1224511 RepID=A0ABY1QTL8_9BURK|nr:hypothetical protein [Noviherbaspirillum suwonense]SMP79606.1 hypothetical protein SAMN06295970_13211 [Noviherbaspirillum suwonense]